MIEEFCAALNARIVSDRYAIDIDLLIEVEDDGPGIAHPENLFVPFFTTKAGGRAVESAWSSRARLWRRTVAACG